MILADKIIKLRKKNGWSQEELADKMNVSRQAVSKWEGAQAIPDLEKILQLAELFGVTTDYLLKDDIEDEPSTELQRPKAKHVSVEFANEYLEFKQWESWKIALATFLCILSPITLIILGGFSGIEGIPVTELMVGVIGLSTLFAFILVAVPIFIYCGFKGAPYAFLEGNERFELEYGVRGILKKRKDDFRNIYVKANIIATCICIFSPIPLIISAFTGLELLIIVMLALTMIIAGCGVFIFIVAGVQNSAIDKLLQEGEYTPKERSELTVKSVIHNTYNCLLVAIYLTWSFLTHDWHITWLVFAVGYVLSPAINSICNLLAKENNTSEKN